MTATNLDRDDVADGRKRAVLLHCLGIEGQRIFQSLGDCPTYKVVVDKLESHFGPRKSVILERHRFRQRGQRPGESISSYAATLNEHAAKCNFGTLTDEMIRDQLIEKTHTPRIRERLLMEPDTLTLHKATTLAEQIENSLSDSHVIASDTVSLEPNPVKVKLKKNPKYKVLTRDSTTEIVLKTTTVIGIGPHKINFQVAATVVLITILHVTQTAQPTDKSAEIVIKLVTLHECVEAMQLQRLNLVLDLGAKVSILNEELYKQHFKAIPLLPTRQMLTSYNGVREEVSKELSGLENLDIIERIDTSLWISNLVVACRKSGDIRLCVDLQDVNKAIIPDKYPLPDLGELTSEFHGSRVFTKLDLRRSYLQVLLAEDSWNLTAFITHEGVFQYKRMPYGLSSAPSAFQKILASVLSDCEGAVHLIDDVAIHGANQAEHDQHLNTVLNKLRKYNLTLNRDKCEFSKDEIDFVGYRVSASGVLPLQSNTKAIMDLPEPANVKELQSFPGTTNFY
ncbi:uncharacterized protein LOC102801680 [Saccoglossus kowalevskii]|uniref:Uncharacterized protein K02A2.6-like n=1 Tax=Saccoglossus kowalevskii TaxID=10224 RepID=A0ABM0MP65_SACKO|nr:PREDICTED: uncharacterized protein K02A2.6-like [Saccoglossus kowalevskii]